MERFRHSLVSSAHGSEPVWEVKLGAGAPGFCNRSFSVKFGRGLVRTGEKKLLSAASSWIHCPSTAPGSSSAAVSNVKSVWVNERKRVCVADFQNKVECVLHVWQKVYKRIFKIQAEQDRGPEGALGGAQETGENFNFTHKSHNNGPALKPPPIICFPFILTKSICITATSSHIVTVCWQ